jgi:hypothetical protein
MIPDDIVKAVIRLVATIFAVQLAIIGFVFWTAYEGRKDAVTSQRAGCERGKLDRTASATFAQGVLDIFQGTDETTPSVVTDKRTESQQKIQKAIEGYKERAKIECTETIPKARLWP